MYREYQRPLTGRERKEIEERLTGRTAYYPFSRAFRNLFLCLLGISLCGGTLYAMVRFNIRPSALPVACTLLGLLAVVLLSVSFHTIGSYFHWRGIDKTFERETAPLLRAALGGEKVSVKQVRAAAVIEITETAEEGEGYLFDLGENCSLLLKGQRYAWANDEESWPNAEFEIVRTADGAQWIGIFATGPELTPVRTVSVSDCRDDFALAECEEIFDKPPDEVLKELLK